MRLSNVKPLPSYEHRVVSYNQANELMQELCAELFRIRFRHPGVIDIFRLEGSLDIAALEKAFKTIMSRHDVLRASFKRNKAQGSRQLTIRCIQKSSEMISFRPVVKRKVHF